MQKTVGGGGYHHPLGSLKVKSFLFPGAYRTGGRI